jgi:mannose-6-phosphate isomerase-like protein (cupin superfamily)
MPAWCELRGYTISFLPPGGVTRLDATPESRDVVIVGRGAVRAGERWLGEGETLEPDAYPCDLVAGDMGATVIRMWGRWGNDTGGLGLFGVREVDDPRDGGDPVDYPKRTTFDAHFHDCDEYWIIFEGHGIAVSEGVSYEVGRGDCIATGMGHHHDFPEAREPVRAVFFETTMEGAKRRGHLWEHTHGPAHPKPERT